MKLGMSQMGEWINDAKVAQKKAEITQKPADWYAAAKAWEKTDVGVERADFCVKMGNMLLELLELQENDA